jgi:hypothetical protein
VSGPGQETPAPARRLGVGQVQYLGLADGVARCTTWTRPRCGRPRSLGAGLAAGAPAPGTAGDLSQDDGGELLAAFRPEDAEGGVAVEEHVHANHGSVEQDIGQRGEGRRHARVARPADRLPVTGQLAQGGVAALDHNNQAQQSDVGAVAVGDVDAAPELSAEADQGVVDVFDVGAVRHRRQLARPLLGVPLEVEDQGVGAVVQELGGEGAVESPSC